MTVKLLHCLIVHGGVIGLIIGFTPGADPEILKGGGGCHKFSGPELPCSRFDPFF